MSSEVWPSPRLLAPVAWTRADRGPVEAVRDASCALGKRPDGSFREGGGREEAAVGGRPPCAGRSPSVGGPGSALASARADLQGAARHRARLGAQRKQPLRPRSFISKSWPALESAALGTSTARPRQSNGPLWASVSSSINRGSSTGRVPWALPAVTGLQCRAAPRSRPPGGPCWPAGPTSQGLMHRALQMGGSFWWTLTHRERWPRQTVARDKAS